MKNLKNEILEIQWTTKRVEKKNSDYSNKVVLIYFLIMGLIATLLTQI